MIIIKLKRNHEPKLRQVKYKAKSAWNSSRAWQRVLRKFDTRRNNYTSKLDGFSLLQKLQEFLQLSLSYTTGVHQFYGLHFSMYHSLRPISARKFLQLLSNFEMKTVGLDRLRKPKHYFEHVIITSVSHVSDSATKACLAQFSISFFWPYALLCLSLSTENKMRNWSFSRSDSWYNCTYTKINAAGFFDLQIIIVLLFSVPQDIRFFVVTHFLVKFWG